MLGVSDEEERRQRDSRGKERGFSPQEASVRLQAGAGLWRAQEGTEPGKGEEGGIPPGPGLHGGTATGGNGGLR